MVVAVGPRNGFVSNTPERLRAARTCYDNMAGAVAVALHDRFEQMGWLTQAAGAAVNQPGAARGNNLGGKRAAEAIRVARAPSDAGKVDVSAYDLTPEGEGAMGTLGVDIEATRALRRRFAYGCVDWSERRPHIAGALGAALLKLVLKRKWVTQDLDSRALRVTRVGERELNRQFGIGL